MKKYKGIALMTILMFLFTLAPVQAAEKNDFIKWVDFSPTYEVLQKTLNVDIATHQNQSEKPVNWIDLLAYLGTKYGGDFSHFKEKDLEQLVEQLKKGKNIEEMTSSMKHYSYFHETYDAILGQYVGYYKVQETENGQLVWKEKYGLKAFSPIAKGYPFEHFDDFGTGRSYGYKRKHLGHDLMAVTGTPVIAVETCYVEVMGWNQYGGWRIGLQSMDGKRYYYYAHLRKNRPFQCDVKEGQVVKAGDVIGYVGRSGYSVNENTNNIKQSHLHFGIQLIFDQSQKIGSKEIWIDAYAITKLLQKNQSEVISNEETKEFYRKYGFDEELVHYANAQAEASIDMPIIMYHSITKGRSVNKKVQITVTEFENDLKYLKDNGYTTIVMDDLISYVNKKKTLPKKPILLTFDDGNYSDYCYLFPLLKKYNMKAVFSIIGKPTDNYSKEGRKDINYPNVTWTQINEMLKSGLFEIQNHSYNLHGAIGSKKRQGESTANYKQRLKNDLTLMQTRIKEMTGQTPTTFTYPLGAISNDSTDALKEMGLSASLGCKEGVSKVTQGDPDSLYLLKRILRPNGENLSDIIAKQMKKNK